MKTIMGVAESQQDEVMLSQLKMVIGIWVNSQIYWLYNQSEKIISKEQLTINVKDEHIHSKVRSSNIYITNHNQYAKEMKLIIMHRYVQASKDHFTFISPSEQVIFHLANKKVFLVNGHYEDQLMQQATIQPFWTMNTDNMWTCKEKGILKYQPMAKGLAVSLFTLNLSIPSNETKKASTWTIQGEAKSELSKLNTTLLKKHTSISFK
ncbi:hypothetical protein ACFSO7_19060 [Bacillus sp. CGMCC 1.16607]|uniref:hypothetical protein n=1 Tax=Bacillus sp. CGMCC 1.16607 TaxID=3351842 RepID=UPI00363C1295